ncbi:hypothetical protein JW865_04675 [Candidatus Bathyarchaeota archaeon]|nr:hypothetical protein [Candidatus Bathyarchaeota archaeon]
MGYSRFNGNELDLMESLLKRKSILKTEVAEIKEDINEVPEACFIGQSLLFEAERQSLFNISEVTNLFGMKVYTYRKW